MDLEQTTEQEQVAPFPCLYQRGVLFNIKRELEQNQDIQSQNEVKLIEQNLDIYFENLEKVKLGLETKQMLPLTTTLNDLLRLDKNQIGENTKAFLKKYNPVDVADIKLRMEEILLTRNINKQREERENRELSLFQKQFNDLSKNIPNRYIKVTESKAGINPEYEKWLGMLGQYLSDLKVKAFVYDKIEQDFGESKDKRTSFFRILRATEALYNESKLV